MKKVSAQELVEFLLVAPFLIILFGILTEYAYAMNINFSLTNALKASTATIYGEIAPDTTQTEIKNKITERVTAYLKEGNAPVKAENNIKIIIANADENTVISAYYTYYSAFTLPNLYFHILPEKFNFKTTQVVPKTIFKGQHYLETTPPTENSKGIMDYTLAGGGDTGKLLFVVPIGGISYFKVVNWQGDDILSGDFLDTNAQRRSCDYSDIYNFTCGSANSFTFPSQYKTIFILSAYVPLGANSVKSAWGDATIPVKSESFSGASKSALAMMEETEDGTRKAVGNFDNIATTKIKALYKTSKVIVYPTEHASFANSMRLAP